jgi:hypothetical protein
MNEEAVDGEAVEVDEGLRETVAESMPPAMELAISDPRDMGEVVRAMDANDVAMLLERVQGDALEKWIYKAGDNVGLSIHGVQDIVIAMNASARCRIRILPETMNVEREQELTGVDGAADDYWSVTIAAVDEVTGLTFIGHSQEPVFQKRRDGSRSFDKFSKTKALQKAQRNALAAHIPEVVEQTVIATYLNDPRRVKPILTVAQAKAAELPPALTGPEAEAKVARARELLAAIHEVGPEARMRYTPGQFHAHLTNAQHDLARLDDFIAYLEERLEKMPGEVAAVRAAGAAS